MSAHHVAAIKCEFCMPLKQLVIYESENFAVLYDPFPLTKGHLMISTHLHYGCGGELDHELVEELMQLKIALTQQLKKKYPLVICYEHGRAGGCHSSNHTERACHHMHLHLLPFELDVSEQITAFLPESIPASYPEIPRLFHSKGNYVYYENSRNEGFFYSAEGHKIPSHLLRTLISNLNQTPERADWENYTNYAVFEETLREFPKDCFKDLEVICKQ